jgi:uncharacterized damage-inducible protein DinB
MSSSPGRPAAGEYATAYARYIDNVPDGDVVALLERQLGETQALLGGLDDARGLHRYAPGKWSVKDVVGHMADSERVFAYRALAIARGERADLPTFEEDDYAAAAGRDRQPLADVLADFAAVRQATLALLRQLDAEAWRRIGSAGGNPISVRALVYAIAGHERHHAGVLRERYLTA